MNSYQILIYIYFVFIECKGENISSTAVPSNQTCANKEPGCFIKGDELCKFFNSPYRYFLTPNYTNENQTNKEMVNTIKMNARKIIDSINSVKGYMSNETNIIKDSIVSVKGYMSNETNIIKDSINSVISSINKTNIIKDQLYQTETLKLQKKIEKLSVEINTFRTNQSIEIRSIIELIHSFRIYISNETNRTKDQLNEMLKSQKKIELLSEKLFICLLVIAIILIIVLLAEVRFKIITKIIQRWSGTNRVNENCHDLSENSNNPLLDSRKSDSLKYELQSIKGEMNRIENVLLTTNSYALSELNTKIEKFYIDLDIQFQSFVKEANETIAKIKYESIMQYESESSDKLNQSIQNNQGNYLKS